MVVSTMDYLFLAVVCTLSGVVIGALSSAFYFQSRYRDIRNAVDKGSLEGFWRLLDEEARYISLLDDALRALDVVQDEVSTTRTRVADTIEWIRVTKTELEAFRGLQQMPPSLKNDSAARRNFGRT
jgi:uncharacterized membrane protein YccC